MSKDEIDIMWQKAMKESIKDGEMYTRYHFAKLVAAKALANPMREVQRLGQEIEQEPPQRTWIGLEGAEAGWFCHTDFLNAKKYTKKQRQHICNQLLSEAQSWDVGEYLLMMHDSTKRPFRSLTDEEYFALQMKIKKPMSTVQNYIDAMQLVEQALKEKNQ